MTTSFADTQIVIPMSGWGERFRAAGHKVPKPLIEVGGMTMVEHVRTMFPGAGRVLLICNDQHLADPDLGMRDLLAARLPDAEVAIIAGHKLGPVHAVLEAADRIDDDLPALICYCDFNCIWDYGDFLAWAEWSGADAAVPSYRGFHPHSLGSTYYAYLRLRPDGWIEAIQEKQPFTGAPMEEYASSGAYWFRSGALLKRALRGYRKDGPPVNGEYYVSMACDWLAGRGCKVGVYEIPYFMQWGTPRDLEEFLHWSRQFERLAAVPDRRNGAVRDWTLVVPAAGAGRRFGDRGIATPKVLIPVDGEPMLVRAARSLPPTGRQRFVLRTDMPGYGGVVEVLAEAWPEGRVVALDGVTEGQAVTCLEALADPSVPPGKPVLVGVSDCGVEFDWDRLDAMAAEGADIVVLTSKGHPAAGLKPESYGWVLAEDERVRDLCLKRAPPEGGAAGIVTGIFWFRSADLLRSCVEALMRRGERVNGEYYVDACISEALSRGLDVRALAVDTYLGWGTPDELATYRYWQGAFDAWPVHPYRIAEDPRIRTASGEASRHRSAGSSLPDPVAGCPAAIP